MKIELDANRRDLWVMRIYYFVWLGGSGFFSPFLNLFYVQQGLSGSEIGAITAISAVVALVVAPIWTRRSSASAHPRRLLQVGLILSSITLLWLGRQHLFWWIAVVIAIRTLVNTGVSPLSDALALATTGATRSGFGSVRVWGSIGWAFVVLLSGWLIERHGFMAGFVGGAVTLLISTVLIQRVNMGNSRPGALSRPRQAGFKATALNQLRNPAMIGLALMLIFIGFGNNGVNQFETVFLDQLGAKESLIGIASMVSSVVEIPGMFWADHLVRKRGAHTVLSISMLMNVALRGLVLAFPSIPMIIAERAVGGISFSFYTVALVKYISGQTEEHETATALALYTVTLASFINILAGPVAGAAYDLFGGAYWLYPIAIVGYLLGWGSLFYGKKAGQKRTASEMASLQATLAEEPEASGTTVNRGGSELCDY